MSETDFLILLAEWCDGARGGLATYRGWPHHFQSEHRDFDDLDATDTFLLFPLPAGDLPDTLRWLVGREAAAAWAAWAGDNEAGPPPEIDTRDAPGPVVDRFTRRWHVFSRGLLATAMLCERAEAEFAEKPIPVTGFEPHTPSPQAVRWKLPFNTLGAMRSHALALLAKLETLADGTFWHAKNPPEPGDPFGGEEMEF